MTSNKILMSDLVKIINPNITLEDFINKYENTKKETRKRKHYDFSKDGFPDNIYEFITEIYGDNRIDTDKYWKYHKYCIGGSVNYKKLRKMSHQKINLKSRLNKKYYLEYSATPHNLILRYNGIDDDNEYGQVILELDELSFIELQLQEFISTVEMID
jgi:hypothetical protein